MTYPFKCDVHTHTLASRHAYSTILENVAAARDAGLELLGCTDHFSDMLYPEQDIRNFQNFINSVVWPRVHDGVVLLRGAEADIVSLDGRLFGQDVECPLSIVGRAYKQEKSLFERVTDGLDYLIASVHAPMFAEGATIARTTEMYVRALENPKVLILGHTGRSGVPFDIDEVLTVAREKRKLIELNEHSLSGGSGERHLEACRAIAERCAELGVGVSVSTDSHIAPAIGRARRVPAMLEEIGFPPELVATRSAAAFLEQMRAAGVCDLTDLAAPIETA